MVDAVIIETEARWLIEKLQANHANNVRATSYTNTRLFNQVRLRAPRRTWPHIGAIVVVDAPSYEYSAAVFLGLDMPSPPDGPYEESHAFTRPVRGPALERRMRGSV